MGSRSREFQVFKLLFESQSNGICEKDRLLTVLTIISFLTVFPLLFFLGGGDKRTISSGMNISPARIALELFLFLEKSPDEVFAFI